MLTKDIFVKGLTNVTKENLKTYLIFVQQYFDVIDEYCVKVQETQSAIANQKPDVTDMDAMEAIIMDKFKSDEMSRLLKDYDRAEKLTKRLKLEKNSLRSSERDILYNLDSFDRQSNYKLYSCLKKVERDYEDLETLLDEVNKFTVERHNYRF